MRRTDQPLTVDQAAKRAGRSRRTVERWIDDGRLPAQIVGGKRYVRESDTVEVEYQTRTAKSQPRLGGKRIA